MESNTLKQAKDFKFADIQGQVSKFKFATIACTLIVIVVVVSAFVVVAVTSISNKPKIVMIDRQGYTYTSTDIDQTQATLLQVRAFILSFIKLSYSFDPNNIENNLNRAVKLADGSFSIYVSKHAKPNDIYQVVKVGAIASINEAQVINSIQATAEGFSCTFTQTIQGSSGIQQYSVSIQGSIKRVTPNGIDNPNGFFITNFIENYGK